MRVLGACVAGIVLLGAIGCSEDPATSMAAAQAASRNTGTQTAAQPVDTTPKVTSRGMRPQRGPVQTMPPGSLSVEFEPALMDFGLLEPGATGTGRTRIWNTGSEPLTISKSITSCGCTSAEDLAGRVIEPGGFTEFSTTMEMKPGLGEKQEKITVYFAPSASYAKERIAVGYYKAEVSLPVKLSPPHLTASTRVGNEWQHTMTGTLDVSSLDGQPFTIIRSHGAEPDIVGFDPETDPPRTQYTLRWDLDRFQDRVMPWYWVVETDHPDAPVIDARIRHSKTLPVKPQGRPWVPKAQRALINVVRPGETVEIKAKIEYHGNQTPAPDTAAVTSESPHLEASLVKAEQKGQFIEYTIALTVAPNSAPGMFYGRISTHASRFSAPLYVIGRVEA